MRKQLTIRGGLVATIAGYTVLLVLVVGASIAALYMGNSSLEAMYRDDTASLLHLKTSSERMLVMRERMSDVAQIISAGHSGKEEIAKLRTLLKQSNDELDAYAGLHARNADEQALFDTLQNRRRALLDGVFLKALSQLDADDGFGFLDTQRTAPPALFAAYQEAIDALEAFQVAREKARYDAAGVQFHRIVWGMAAVAAFALVVGFLAQRVLAKAIIEPIKLAVGQFEKISKGDLTGTVVVPGENEMAYLLHALKRMQDGLVVTVNQVRASTETIVGDVRTIASGNVDLSARTEQQAVSLQQAAASVEQLTAAVRQNADNARDARTYVEGASGIASRGGEAMQRVVETMSAISLSSTRISGIVGVIESIAFQTNILALNAAVEAARARGAALRVGGEGDPRTDRPFRAACRRRQRPRRTGRLGDGRTRRGGRARQHDHERNRPGVRGAGVGHRAGERRGHPDGADDAAQCRAGRGGRGRGAVARRTGRAAECGGCAIPSA